MSKSLYSDGTDSEPINQFVGMEDLVSGVALEKSKKKKKRKKKKYKKWSKKGMKKLERRLRAFEENQQILLSYLSNQQSNYKFSKSDCWQKVACTVLPKGIEIVIDRLLAKK